MHKYNMCVENSAYLLLLCHRIILVIHISLFFLSILFFVASYCIPIYWPCTRSAFDNTSHGSRSVVFPLLYVRWYETVHSLTFYPVIFYILDKFFISRFGFLMARTVLAWYSSAMCILLRYIPLWRGYMNWFCIVSMLMVLAVV